LNLYANSKLKPRFIGPFKILQRVGPAAYRLDLQGRYQKIHPVFHVSLLRPHRAGGAVGAPPQPILVDDQEEFELEKILRHR